MGIHKVAVVGAGTMGSDIAQVITEAGLTVLLKDVDPKMLDRGCSRARSIFRRRVEHGRLSRTDMEARLGLLSPTLDYAGFGDVDFVIEAVPEKLDLKKAVLEDLDRVCHSRAVLATNTSALSVSELAASTSRPHRVAGMHFFNPAHVMKLVEVIPGLDTEPETIERVVRFARHIAKVPIVVQECPGFLVNRVLMAYLNEAARALQERVATAKAIDDTVVAWGMPMGPLSLMDMIGIDVCSDIIQYLHAEYGDRRQPACIFARLLECGRLGQKVGAGFYDYPGGESEVVRQMVAEIGAPRREAGRSPFRVERLIYPMINEAAQCVLEHVATMGDIDTAMVTGTGMTYGGQRLGPLAIADRIGLDEIVRELSHLQQDLGPRFRPAHPLTIRVRAGHLGERSGKGFYVHPGFRLASCS
jgi:3-hydroxyacyl-CoA dehydrogenase